MGHGIGMPRGLPRTKRTAKPQRGVYDVLQRLRMGLVEREPVINESTVWIYDGHMTVMVPREMYDRHMGLAGHTNGVHINIRVNTPVDKLEP